MVSTRRDSGGERPRVVLIHQAFVSPQEAGGTRHFELGRRLVERGFDFTVVASCVSYLTGKPVAEAGAAEDYDGVRVLRAYASRRLHRGYVWRVLSFLSFFASSIPAALRAGRVDLVMGTTPPIFQAVSAWIVSVLRRRPFLLEVRDLWPEFAIDIGILRNPVLIGLSRWLERFLYRRAAHILVNSPAYRTYLLSKGVAAEKISVIPNGVDPQMFDPAASGERVRLDLGLDGKFVVTYSGALGMANDIETVLRTARRLADDATVHFVIVGDGKERAKLEQEAAGLGNVTFVGAQPKSRVPEFLAASDACLATLRNIPMFRTTYPNKVFDYMAAGRPTVLAIDGVIREVVEQAGGGVFVTPGDDAAMAAAIAALAHDRQRARAMGLAARAHVEQHFRRDQQAEDFYRLIARLVGVKGRRP